MRKLLVTALAAVLCGGTLSLTTASEAAAAGPPVQCVKVRKFYTKGHQRYVRLTNLCSRRPACYVIVVPHHADPRGRLAKGATKNVRYAKTSSARALYVKNVRC
ncbi:hypothetical protein [Streptomyces sp. NPDC014733]|uniref:hypothetical protein n=1 Tax=Streptomyces sp. NPDC014733 TaxID=3364885 RepID=UPI0036FF426B